MRKFLENVCLFVNKLNRKNIIVDCNCFDIKKKQRERCKNVFLILHFSNLQY